MRLFYPLPPFSQGSVYEKRKIKLRWGTVTQISYETFRIFFLFYGILRLAALTYNIRTESEINISQFDQNK